MKYLYEVIAVFNGKSAGFLGFATTKDKARLFTCKISRRIKRVKVEEDLYNKILSQESKKCP